MKTEIEKKLDKLPIDIYDLEHNLYQLIIRKNGFDLDDFVWVIEYVDVLTGNTYLLVSHKSLQAAVDTTLKEIKKINNA